MELTREQITSIYETLWDCINFGDWKTWLEYFSDTCKFSNSAMEEEIRGKDSLTEIANTFPAIINVPEWFAIDGQRLVVSWQESPCGVAEELAYRGVSSFYFDSEGKISDYVGTFNMQDVVKAFS